MAEFTLPMPPELKDLSPEDRIKEIDRIQRKLEIITPTNHALLKRWSFTREARVHLAVFSDEILLQAETSTPRSLPGEERFKYFFQMCKAYAKQTDTPYSEAYHRHLIGIFKINPHAPCTRHKIISLNEQERRELSKPIVQGRKK